jgi:predicted component of type VI protein secretion system
MMTIYEGSEQMIKKIKEERTVEVQKDIFDLAMKKITTQAELEMLNLELKSIIDAYAKDIDLKKLGLEFE